MYPSAGPTAEQTMKIRHESVTHGSLREKPTHGKHYKTIRRTIDVGATKAILRAKGKTALEPGQKGMYLCAATDAIWPRTRLAEAGYEIDPMCEKCGQEPDTLHHRIWKCQEFLEEIDNCLSMLRPAEFSPTLRSTVPTPATSCSEKMAL